MDPVTIVTSVAKITSTCLTTGKIIYDFSCKYQDAPRNILAISTEATVISASLAQIQALILSKENPEQVLHSRPEIAATLDTSLTGCMVLFSCLDQELREIKRDAHRQGREKLSFKGKIKTVWKQETFQELLDGIRGQQLAINTLIQLLQMDSLSEIKQLLKQKAPELKQNIERTESLRRSYPSVRVAESIYNQEDRMSIYTAANSSMPSDLEFDFDDIVVNSAAYQRVLAAARHKASASQCEEDVGDLIDFSDDALGRQVPVGTDPKQPLTIPEDLLGLRFSTDNDEPTVAPNLVPEYQWTVKGSDEAAKVPVAKPSLRPLKDASDIPRPALHDDYVLYHNVRLSRQDVLCIKDGWFTDGVIAFWEEYLEREKIILYPSAKITLLRPSMGYLIMRSRDDQALKRAFPDMQKVSHIFLPVNNNPQVDLADGGTHWSLLLVSTIDKVAYHYDSCSPLNRAVAEQCSDQIGKLLNERIVFTHTKSPQQGDSRDSGVFVCLLMVFLLTQNLLQRPTREKFNADLSRKTVDASGGRRSILEMIEARRKAAKTAPKT